VTVGGLDGLPPPRFLERLDPIFCCYFLPPPTDYLTCTRYEVRYDEIQLADQVVLHLYGVFACSNGAHGRDAGEKGEGVCVRLSSAMPGCLCTHRAATASRKASSPEDRKDANFFLHIWIHLGKLGY
jgi:hypothetical protein